MLNSVLIITSLPDYYFIMTTGNPTDTKLGRSQIIPNVEQAPKIYIESVQIFIQVANCGLFFPPLFYDF